MKSKPKINIVIYFPTLFLELKTTSYVNEIKKKIAQSNSYIAKKVTGLAILAKLLARKSTWHFFVIIFYILKTVLVNDLTF